MVKMILSEKHGHRLTTSQRNGEFLAKMCHHIGNDVPEDVAAWSMTTYVPIWNSWVDWSQCSNKQRTEQLNKRVELCEGDSSSLAPHCCSIHGRGRTGCEEQTESNANVKSQKMMWHFYSDFSLYLWFKSILCLTQTTGHWLNVSERTINYQQMHWCHWPGPCL